VKAFLGGGFAGQNRVPL